MTGLSPCPPAVATITVNVIAAPVAGTNASVTRCSNAASFSLFNQLGGTPQSGGTWVGPDGPHAVTFNPATDTPGAYVYTVQGTAPCGSASSVVNVTIIPRPRAGGPGSRTVCANAPSFNLINYLTGVPDAGGVWTGPGNVANDGTFIPGTSPAGVYIYTVAGTPPCTDATATVNVTVVQPPNPGVGTTLTICSNASSVNLFSLLSGSPQSGGTWTKPGGGAHSGTYQPATDPNGNYTYTVSGTTPCASQSAVVQVTRTIAPNAGTDAGTTVCNTNSPFALFNLLGGSPNGTGAWLDPALQPFAGTFTPGTSTEGEYAYVVNGTGPCANDTGFVMVDVNVQPSAGQSSSIAVCDSQSPFGLIGSLGGSPTIGGTWTKPNGTSSNGTFTPSSSTAGNYTYTVTALSPCIDVSAIVTVELNHQPFAGNDDSITRCSTDGPVNLFNELNGGPETGGTWVGPDGASNGTFTPGSSSQGNYIYTIAATAPCVTDAATISVNVNQAPNAGGDGAVTVCLGNGTVDLFTALVGSYDLGGTWQEQGSPTGQLTGSVFDYSGLPVGSYGFEYEVDGNGQCGDDHAHVTVTITAQLDAGSDSSPTTCGNSSSVNLFNLLGGSPQGGGIWIDLDNTLQLTGQVFNASAAGAGVYHFRYKLVGSAGCPADSALVTVTVISPPFAGNDASTTVCSTASQFSMFALLTGGAQAGGSWHVGAPNGPNHSPSYNPPVDSPNDFYYVVGGTAPCPSDNAKVTVNEVQPANAGGDGTGSICSNGSPINMFSLLTGGPNVGGSWYFNNQPHAALYDPFLDVSGLYEYRVQGPPQCGVDVAVVNITENQVANAGCNTSVDVCSGIPPFLLFNLLPCGPLATGTWRDPNMQVHNGTFTPGVSLAGDYRYIVLGSAPCINDTAIVSVFISPSPNAGCGQAAPLCSNSGQTDLFTYLGCTPDAGGVWTGPSPQTTVLAGGLFTPGQNAAGTYTYTVSNSCGSATTTVAVSVAAAPNAGCDTTITICSNSAAFAMVNALGCSPGNGGSWVGPLPATTSMTGIFFPGVTALGSYRYTVNGTNGCANGSAVLTVNVNNMPSAGCDANYATCNDAAQVDLNTLLTCSATPGGIWLFNGSQRSNILNPAQDPSGNYVYRVTGVFPCGMDEAVIHVTISTRPNAGIDGSAQTCSDGLPFTLITQLTGGPQLNGVWTYPNGTTSNGIYVPGTDPPGLYKYKILGVGGCSADSSYVTVIQSNAVFAGGDAVTLVCSDASPFSMFNLLTGTPSTGGNWYGPNGTSTTEIFDPGSSTPGVYKYKVLGTAPCTNDSATVTVFVNHAPNAGISDIAEICSSSNAVSLITLLSGTPDPNGTWSYDGDDVGPAFDPANDPQGSYTYTVVGVAPCASQTAQVVVVLTPDQSAGTSGVLTACVNDSNIDLRTGLLDNPTAGGVWSTACTWGSLSGWVFDATGMPANAGCTFTYTQAANGPCVAHIATVDLSIVSALDAGADSSSQACQGEVLNLYNAVGGNAQPGGFCVNVNNAPGVIGCAFNTVSVGVGTVWHFDYVLPGGAQCDPDTAHVTITVLEGAFAGCDGATTICSNNAPVNLATTLGCGPDPGGSWFKPDWTPFPGGTFVVATDTPGIYHYVVGGVGSCPPDTADVTVNVVAAANAGADAPLATCSNDLPTDMFLLLGPNAHSGGAWVYVTGGNISHNNIYNPAIDAPSVYKYCVVGTFPCPTDCAFITVTEPQAPNAGCDEEVTVCSSESSFSMRSRLTCTPAPGGNWIYVEGGNTAHGNFFDPAVDPSGTYIYIVAGTAPCAADSATLIVHVQSAANAGASSTVEACLTQTAVDLFAALGPNAQPGGTWTDQNSSNALVDSTFNPSVAGIGSWPFVYTILGTGPCQTVSATITVNVGTGSSAGADSSVTVCGSITDLILFDQLGGNPTPGGAWLDLNGSGALGPNGIANVSVLPIGGSTPFGYTVLDAGCGAVSAIVHVTATAYPVAGTGASLTLCSNATAVDLFTQLGGTPDVTGSWIGPNSLTHTQIFTPGTDEPGNYTYTVTGVAPCNDAIAVIDVVVNDPPSAGGDGATIACDTLSALDLFTVLQGVPSSGGTWTDLNTTGGLTGGALNTTAIVPGQYGYRYVASAAGCANDTSVVNVTVVTSVEVLDVVRTCIERDRMYVVTFTIQNGDANTYEVTGLGGSISATAPYVFTSDSIFTSQAFEVFVRDQYACGVIRVAGETPCDFDTDVFIPETFSPNGDGVNELFLIPGIEGYPQNTITIFNRWGAKMFDGAGYDNRTVVWNGTSPDAALAGPAPAGTYFYVLDLGNGMEALTGYVYLNR
ncbi:MAG TPA: gliding motility-associated C-terminal domain-containing protein [Flavobacteriales bacterium]|nr:gliding motility-associated C-terminal domain-containing protein [Flavobacteriales bacterium]